MINYICICAILFVASLFFAGGYITKGWHPYTNVTKLLTFSVRGWGDTIPKWFIEIAHLHKMKYNA